MDLEQQIRKNHRVSFPDTKMQTENWRYRWKAMEFHRRPWFILQHERSFMLQPTDVASSPFTGLFLPIWDALFRRPGYEILPSSNYQSSENKSFITLSCVLGGGGRGGRGFVLKFTPLPMIPVYFILCCSRDRTSDVHGLSDSDVICHLSVDLCALPPI